MYVCMYVCMCICMYEALKKIKNIFGKLNQIVRSEIFCLGDFNIDLTRPSKDRK